MRAHAHAPHPASPPQTPGWSTASRLEPYYDPGLGGSLTAAPPPGRRTPAPVGRPVTPATPATPVAPVTPITPVTGDVCAGMPQWPQEYFGITQSPGAKDNTYTLDLAQRKGPRNERLAFINCWCVFSLPSCTSSCATLSLRIQQMTPDSPKQKQLR